MLVIGFGMLLGSQFIPNSNLGLLTMFILGSALFLDFFLLPPLLILIDKKRSSPVGREDELPADIRTAEG